MAEWDRNSDGTVRSFASLSKTTQPTSKQRRLIQDNLSRVMAIVNEMPEDNMQDSLVVSLIVTQCMRREKPLGQFNLLMRRSLEAVLSVITDRQGNG